MAEPALLSIDLGTSACKVVLYQAGRVVASSSAPVTTRHGAHGLAEQDPEAWWAMIAALVPEVVGARSSSVAAIGVTGQSDSLVLADASGSAIRPCMLWMDGRGGEELETLRARLGDRAIRATTGLRPALSFTAAKVAWVGAHEPEALAHARWILQPKDLIALQLTGVAVTDPSSASRSMMMDRASGRWWPDMIEALGIEPTVLPAIRPSGSVAGPLTHDAARSLGLRPGTPVAVGAADRAAEALASGLEPGEVMVSQGTASGIVMAMPASDGLSDDAILVPMHALPGQAMALLSVATSGAALEWILRTLGSPTDRDVLLAEAAESPPGAAGVRFLPFLMGAKSVRWAADARGAFVGLDLSVRRGDLVRAGLEGIAFETDACVGRLAAARGPVDRMVLVGGGQRDDLAATILIDVAGIAGLALDEPHAAAAGAMLLAGQSIGLWPDPSEVARRRRHGRLIEPAADRHAIYRGLAADYERLCASMGLPAVGASTGEPV